MTRGMPRYGLKIEYDGAPFAGWQRQTAQPSVQGTIEAALARLEPGGCRVQGAGRTDAGVHATGQVGHVDLPKVWDPFRLSDALNHYLKPAPIAIVALAGVGDDWHARFSAVQRSYLYRVLCRRPPAVQVRGQVWQVRHPLDVDAMERAAAHLIGQHDFTTFRAAQCQAASPVKTLDRIDIAPHGDEVHFRFHARSFLHNQVRSLVGTLERVGAGAWAPGDVAEAMARQDRSACGPVAPPTGLFLTDVQYPVDPFAD